MKLEKYNDQILMVKQDILNRFPNCGHTIFITIWDDDTASIQCRYGDGEKIYTSTFYNNELVYEEITQTGEVMIVDEYGNKHLKYLRDK